MNITMEHIIQIIHILHVVILSNLIVFYDLSLIYNIIIYFKLLKYMNIIEAYLKYKGYHIILLSGYSGSRKTLIAQFLAKHFNYNYINLSHFYYSINEYSKKSDNTIWEDIYKSVDWTKFNNYVNEYKTRGIVISGFGFPAKLINFTATHIYIKISKENLLLEREKYIISHGKPFDKNIELDNIILEEHITTKVYDWIINGNKLKFDEAKYDAFRFLISNVSAWLKKYNSVDTITKKIQDIPPMTNEDKIYEEFYYPDRKKKKLYDVNNQGYPYPSEFQDKYNEKYISNSTTTSSISSSSI